MSTSTDLLTPDPAAPPNQPRSTRDSMVFARAWHLLVQLMGSRTYVFSLVLAVVLIIANVIVLPAFGAPSSYAATLGALAPFALVGMASVPAILAGGIDVSIGPAVGLIGILYVVYMQPNGLGGVAPAIVLCLFFGAALGAINGVLISFLRYQPVIATLCMYFILGGVGEAILPTARQAPANWTDHLGNSIGPIPGGLVTICAPLVIWWALKRRTAFVSTLLAVGGRDTAALTAGINIGKVRMIAYVLGGVFAGIAALALTGLTQDADPTIGAQYTLVALAGASIGGTVIGGGGRGGLVGAVFGAACIFLIQNLVSNLGFSPFWLQVVYGIVLVVTMVVSRHRAAASSSEDFS